MHVHPRRDITAFTFNKSSRKEKREKMEKIKKKKKKLWNLLFVYRRRRVGGGEKEREREW